MQPLSANPLSNYVGIPTRAVWGSSSTPNDYFTAHGVPFVSERFRRAVDLIEPGVHQFLPIQIENSGRSENFQFWYWVVCNRVDSVDRETTNLVFFRDYVWLRRHIAEGVKVRSPEKVIINYNANAIGDLNFWRDSYLRKTHLFTSENAMKQLRKCDFTGIGFVEEKTV